MVIGSIPAAKQMSPLEHALVQARDAGVPQWAVARTAGISGPHLTNIARARVRPSRETAYAVAAALGCDPYELFPESSSEL